MVLVLSMDYYLGITIILTFCSVSTISQVPTIYAIGTCDQMVKVLSALLAGLQCIAPLG